MYLQIYNTRGVITAFSEHPLTTQFFFKYMETFLQFQMISLGYLNFKQL